MNEPPAASILPKADTAREGMDFSGGWGITFGDTPSWYAVQLLWCYGQGETQRQHTDKTQLIRSLNLSATHIISKADASKTQTGYEQLDLYTDYTALETKRRKEQADLEHEQKMRFFGNHLEEHLAIAVTFFIPDAKKTSGSHAAKTG